MAPSSALATLSSYKEVTEIPGEYVSSTQLLRAASRYRWAAEQSSGLELLEVACGCGQGLGLVGVAAARVVAGDFSEDLVAKAKAHYGPRFEIDKIDAHALPYDTASFDVVLLSEALYYLDAERFLTEARRVLRPGGKLLLVTVNKDLAGFQPSMFSTHYFGVKELNAVLLLHGFRPRFWGDSPSKRSIVRRLKRIAVGLNLLPKTMQGKRALRRLIYGKLVPMPPELREQDPYVEPTPIGSDTADSIHEVLFCSAERDSF